MEGKAVLHNLLGDEQSLTERAKMLKSDLEELNSKMVSKQNQVDWLLAQVAELKLGKRPCKFPNEEENGESHLGRKLVNERDIEPERLAETLLLEEIWSKIFGKMKDGLDLLNASRTCHHFNDILHPLKNNFLFGSVFPLLFLHLNINDVLKCRLVCRDWRSAINSILEEWSKAGMLNDASRNNYVHPFGSIIESVICAYFFCCEDLSNFLQEFSSARNPFVSNSITISLDDESYKLKFHGGIETFLETFGRHIHHFEWFGEDFTDESSRPVVAELLRKLFSKAQNLQTLVFHDEKSYDYLYVGDDHFPKFSIEDVTDSLPNFKTLVYSMDDRFPICNWLFRNFHLQITKLELFSLDGLIAASKFSWPLVTELGFHLCITHDVCVRRILRSLKSYPILNKLALFVPRFPDDGIPYIIQMVKYLSERCPCFHSLVLTCYKQFSKELLQHETLIAPNQLVNFELIFLGEGSLNKCDFAFLLRFPYIKRLSILLETDLYRDWQRNFNQGNKLEIVELRKYLKPNSNPRSSNVWRMLPNLETLQIQNNIYKRPKTSCTK